MSTGGGIFMYKASQGEFSELTDAEVMLLPINIAYAGRTVLEKLTIASLKSQAAKRAAAYIAVLLANGAPHVENIKAVIISWFKKVTGEVIDNIDGESILHAGGRAAAKTFSKKLRQKYGFDCPITDFYSDTIIDELGEWLAELANKQIKLGLHTDVDVFTSFMPPDNIIDELDAFICGELNRKLGTNIESVLAVDDLETELKLAVFERAQTEFTNLAARAKGEVINQLQGELTDTVIDGNIVFSKAQKMAIISDIGTRTIEKFSNFNLLGVQLTGGYVSNRTRIHNKMRQREYRRTHKENRVWVDK